jgi:hypothetical protein
MGFVSNVTQLHCRELTNSTTMRSTSKRGVGYSGVPLRDALEYVAGMVVMANEKGQAPRTKNGDGAELARGLRTQPG